MSEAPAQFRLFVLRPGPAGVELACAHRARGQRRQGDEWVLPGGEVGAREPWESALAQARGALGLPLPDAWPLLPCGEWLAHPFAPARPRAFLFLAAVAAGTGLPAPEALGPGHDRLEWIAPGELLARWRGDEALIDPLLRAALGALGGLATTGRAADWPAGNRGAGAAQALEAACPPGGEWPGAVDLSPGIRVFPLHTPTLPPATHTNCLVIGDGSELVVIDPASPWPEEQARLDALLDGLLGDGRRVRALLLTHHHPDHVSGAAHLAARLRAPVAAHRRTAELLRGQVHVDQPLEDGHLLELPADRPGARPRRLRAHLLEGHADGHLVFHEEVTGQVVAGDMVAGTGTILIDPPEGKMALYLRSLERLAGLGARLLYPAHGPPIGDPAGLAREYVAHRLMREAKVLAAVQAGPGEVEALVPRAYDDTPPALYPLAARSLLAHLHKLAEDGRVALQGERWAPLG